MSKPTIDQWNEYQRYFTQELFRIVIPAEIQANEIKQLTYQLNKLYDEIFFDFTRFKTLYENIDDLIDEVTKRNAIGPNVEARKKSGYDAAADYTNHRGETYNLLELRRNYRERYNFIKGVMDSIQSKKSSLITDSAVLKLEASLLGGQ